MRFEDGLQFEADNKNVSHFETDNLNGLRCLTETTMNLQQSRRQPDGTGAMAYSVVTRAVESESLKV